MAGSHKGRSKQTDAARRENEKVNPVKDEDLGKAGLSLVYQCGLPGPHLDCLGAVPPNGHRVLEAKVRNRRGVLPTSLILGQESHQTTQVDDPWLREVFCILARSHSDNKQPTYLAQFFIKPAELSKDEGVRCPRAEYTTPLQVLEVDLEVSLGDQPSQIDSTGVRGHARGLVSRVMIDRLDGTTASRPFLLGTGTEVESGRGTRVELGMLRSTAITAPQGISGLLVSHLRTLEADCIQALMRRIFHKAKALDHLLLNSLVEETPYGTPVTKVSPRSLGHKDEILELETEPFPVTTEVEDIPLSDTKTAAPGEKKAPTTPPEFVSASTVSERSSPKDVNDQRVPGYIWENVSGVDSQRAGTAESRSGELECLTNPPQKALLQRIPNSTSRRDTQQPCNEKEALLKDVTRNLAQINSTNNNIKWTSAQDKSKPAMTKKVGTFLVGLICCMSVRKR
ncbi:uncharacterized protein LOC135475856 [Liolophura sinensis]|uniref:uncharacterized protein LOC135475856 n=1 Tax=Liolophura sinensis TaxID=3198878 RepID=UPI00315810B4